MGSETCRTRPGFDPQDLNDALYAKEGSLKPMDTLGPRKRATPGVRAGGGGACGVGAAHLEWTLAERALGDTACARSGYVCSGCAELPKDAGSE